MKKIRGGMSRLVRSSRSAGRVPARALAMLALADDAPRHCYCGDVRVRFSMTWSMVKLAGFWRGG